jgi:hypothetical protein
MLHAEVEARASSSGDRASTAMASSSSASPRNKQGRVRSGCRGGAPCMQKRSRECEGWVDGNLHPCRRSTRSSASSGDSFASAAMRRGSASEREWSGGEWATGGGFQRGLELITAGDDLVLGGTGDGLHWVSWAAVRDGIVR